MLELQHSANATFKEHSLQQLDFQLRPVFDQRLAQRQILLLGINPGWDSIKMGPHRLDEQVRAAYGCAMSQDIENLGADNGYIMRYIEFIRMVWGESASIAKAQDTFYLNMCLFGSPSTAKKNMHRPFRLCRDIVYRIFSRVSPRIVFTHGAVWDYFWREWGIPNDFSRCELRLSSKKRAYCCSARDAVVGETPIPLLICVPHWHAASIHLSDDHLRKAAEFVKNELAKTI